MYSQIEQQILDIDWFFTNGVDVGFVASGGGKLPLSVANNYSQLDTLLTDYFMELPYNSDIIINANLSQILGEQADDMYLDYFIEMTRKGLYAFDRTILNNFSATQIHLVASPTVPLRLDEFPDQIKEILIKTRYEGDIITISNSNLVT
ncbi:hypothetical protein ACPPVU_03630 [Mucilaginibacter sp. McL0603]|uniref:hypothetical protein n=1 Tax=Mucilaginibacter sp. McL0603 TaxID=3415670 RepID=UPI003CF334F4